MKKILSFILLLLSAAPMWAQFDTDNYNSMTPDGTITNQRNRRGKPTHWGQTKRFLKASMYGLLTVGLAIAQRPSPIRCRICL